MRSAPVAQAELDDFARRIGDHMATRNTPWPDDEAMREAVRETVNVLYGKALFEAWPIMQVQAKALLGDRA